MNRDFLSCDWGTTSFRLRRVAGPDRAVIREIREQAGVKSLYEEALRSGEGIEAARASQHRNPDAFTGFDLDDNVRMRKLWRPAEGIAPRLLHVVNMTLNVVHTTNLAWQQRKASGRIPDHTDEP